jgi:hypothetical protein
MSENGVKTADSGNQAATKSPENAAINAPADAPKNGGDWAVTGQGQVSHTSGGSTSTSNITTFDSSYGSTGTGKGDGTGSGTGSGDGSGDGDGGDDDGVGSGSPRSDLYTKTDKTTQTVLSNFYSQVKETPMVGGISTFMTVPSGGTCPQFALSASKYWAAMSYNGHCGGDFLAFLRAAGCVILAIAAYFAIRIAVT